MSFTSNNWIDKLARFIAGICVPNQFSISAKWIRWGKRRKTKSPKTKLRVNFHSRKYLNCIEMGSFIPFYYRFIGISLRHLSELNANAQIGCLFRNVQCWDSRNVGSPLSPLLPLNCISSIKEMWICIEIWQFIDAIWVCRQNWIKIWFTKSTRSRVLIANESFWEFQMTCAVIDFRAPLPSFLNHWLMPN